MKYEQLFKNKRLYDVRVSVSKQIFKVFMENYIKSLAYTTERLDDRTFTVSGFFKRTVTILGSDSISCSCRVMDKTWLLCSHSLKVLSQLGMGYVEFIPTRWKL